MLKFLRSPDFSLGASASLIVVVAALVGQFAARGMSLQQWYFGITAIAASIGLATVLRCWPKTATEQVQADD